MSTIQIGQHKYKSAFLLETPTLREKFKLVNLDVAKVTKARFTPNVASLIGDNIYLHVPAKVASYAVWSNTFNNYLITFQLEKAGNGKECAVVTGFYLTKKEISAFRQGITSGLVSYERAADSGNVAANWASKVGAETTPIQRT